MSRQIKLLFIAALVFRIIFAFWTYHPDVRNHVDWGIRFFEYGPKGFYAPEANVWSFTWPNQPPGSILLYAGIFKLFELVFGFFWLINIKIPLFPSVIVSFFESTLYPALLQLPSIVADFGIATLIYKIVKKYKSESAYFAALIFLFNPVIWYNSSVWGQTDAIVNFFGLLAFYLLFRGKPSLGILSFAVSIYIKISLAIFTPLLLIVLIKKYKLSKVILSTIPSVFVVGLVTLMFSNGEPFAWLHNLYQTKVLTQQLQVITANAFNVWATVAGIHEQPHTLPFLGLTYKHWGYILFTASFLPVLYYSCKKLDEKRIYTALALTGFAVWMFMTNMHERYLYPLFPYFTIIVALKPRLLLLYLVASGLNLLNLYNFWWTPRIEPLVSLLSFGDRLMPRVFGGVFLAIYLRLFTTLRREKLI